MLQKIAVVFICFISCCLSQEISCPLHPTADVDTYDVAGRHAKLVKAWGRSSNGGADGTKMLTVKKQHLRIDKDTGDLYEYKISLCGQANTGIIQTDTNTQKDTFIGRYNDSKVFGGVDWMMYLYSGGDKYGSFCDKEPRRTLLYVKCEPGDRVRELHVIEEARSLNAKKDFSERFCYYLLEYNHPAACSLSSVKRARKLGAGSVLCIIFVSISAAYIILGMLYKRFVSQAKGFDQIPNYNFWRQLGNLSADGCDLVFRRQQQPANSYKGMADALNIDSSDDEKDDHLLPM